MMTHNPQIKEKDMRTIALKVKTHGTKLLRSLLGGVVACFLFLATPAWAFDFTLSNLEYPPSDFIAEGNRRCPDQPFFLYSGGDPDNFVGPDPAYPSPDLVSYLSGSVQGIVDYDTTMLNGRFGDSFNLQNTRSVCYAVIRFRVSEPVGLANTDSLAIGHLDATFTFNHVAGILYPAFPGAVIQTYAFDATGLGLLSTITGGATPLDSVLDIYIQDDTMIDFVRLWVWYGPPAPPPCTAETLPTC
jgi:hypothetical protein